LIFLLSNLSLLRCFIGIPDNSLTTTNCTKVLKPTDWDPKKNQAVIPIQILAQRDPKKDHDKNLALHFQQIFSGDAPPIFNGYNIPYLPVYLLFLVLIKCDDDGNSADANYDDDVELLIFFVMMCQ
jgi:hypothetical protein